VADESANWRIAGLRQIERLIFGLEEMAAQKVAAAPQVVEVVWNSTLPVETRQLPDRRYAATVELREISSAPEENPAGLSTHLLVTRNGLGAVLSQLNGNGPLSPAIENHGQCRLITDRSNISAAESWFMKSLGKPQDGLIARYLDRRISTRISRWLIRCHARPIHATFAALLFGLAGCALVWRGDYLSVVLGAIMLYGFSVLDGCDGEIARACFLDSASGRRLDLIVDTFVNVLFLICLGFGLGHPSEGVVTALLMSASEAMFILIGRQKTSGHADSKSPLYDRHQKMLGRAGALKINPRLVHLFAQLTKRDVAWLAFIFLAAIRLPVLMLHLTFLVTLVVAVVTVSALIPRSRAPER
jgi:phosphatidylglycerophosphate synthase